MLKVYSYMLVELKVLIRFTFLVSNKNFIEWRINVCFQTVKYDLYTKDQNISVWVVQRGKVSMF